MEIDEEKNGCNGIRKPLTLDWDHLLEYGDDDRPPEVIVTSIKRPVDDSGGSTEADTLENQEQDIELMTKTDCEINEIISRQKNLDRMCDKLPDRGEKLKATLKRYKTELERRNKAKLQKVENESKETIQLSDHSDDGDSCGKRKSDQKSISASKFTKSFLNKLAEDDTTLRERIDTQDSTIATLQERVDKQDATITTLREQMQTMQRVLDTLLQKGYEAYRSHEDRTQNLEASDVEAPLAKRLSPRKAKKGPLQYAPWTDPKSTPCDPLTDEKMQSIVDELVRVGLSEIDVGKAAEVCYNDPVKVKVLIALPSHMRKSYVCGFLHPPS